MRWHTKEIQSQSMPRNTIPLVASWTLTTSIGLTDNPRGIVHMKPHASTLLPTMIKSSPLDAACDWRGITSDHLVHQTMEAISIHFLNLLIGQPLMQPKHGIWEPMAHMGNNNSISGILRTLQILLLFFFTLNQQNWQAYTLLIVPSDKFFLAIIPHIS